MASEPDTGHQPPLPGSQPPATGSQPPDPDKPPGYQPTTGRKLFMMALCIAGLIFLWTYYFFATRQH